MTGKRFILSQNGTFHTVKDNVENKSLGIFEFKDDEFSVYACFHKIIDLMNNLSDENDELKLRVDYLERKIQRMLDELKKRNEEEYVEEDIGYYMTKGWGLND